jgi:hypothetical protein
MEGLYERLTQEAVKPKYEEMEGYYERLTQEAVKPKHVEMEAVFLISED